ncbi:hypothetical protein Hanom_Chr12g01116151 [Helianthus anomalus]
MVEKLKKMAEEVIDESEKKIDENLKKTAEEAEVPDQTEVKTQTESSESSNKDESMGNNIENNEQSDNKKDVQCRKCMETCSVCIENDEKLKSRNVEFTKIEKVFKEKCKEMFENENILKQKEEKLLRK